MSSQISSTTTARVTIRPQTIREAYEPPANGKHIIMLVLLAK